MSAVDAVIVGAGPAGLIAATYLGRFRRRVLVLEGGAPRASWIPLSHNIPGFPEGVSGPELIHRLRSQAARYGARFLPGFASEMCGSARGLQFAVGGQTVGAPFAILATGILDHKPPIDGLDDAIRGGLVRICPVCDAYEAIDKRIAVLGNGPAGVREALFLRNYSPTITLISFDYRPDDELCSDLAGAAIDLLPASPQELRLDDGVVSCHPARGGAPQVFDHLYLALGCERESRLAVKWGAAHDSDNNLIVDAHQETSIAGLYAAGDVVLGLNQIVVAAAEAAIAATAIHNRLRCGNP